MAFRKIGDHLETFLLSPIDDSVTEIEVVDNIFEATGYYILDIWSVDYDSPSQDVLTHETVLVSANTAGTLTVTRGYNGTTPVAHNEGDHVKLLFHAEHIEELQDAITALESGKQDSLGFTPEDVSNKSTDTALGTSDTLYPSQKAVKTYVDNVAVGLLDDRGNYDASGNTFPASGGSGTAGAILKGDIWVISVAGTLGGVAVEVGDQVRALTDTPGQTASNWAVSQVNLTPTSLGGLINNSTEKTTPVDGDFISIIDSAASFIGKKLSWANIKATLKTYFDSLYTGEPLQDAIAALIQTSDSIVPYYDDTGAALYLDVSVDDVTIEVDTVGNHIQVKAGGIGMSHLSSEVTDAIAAGGSSPLSPVRFDTWVFPDDNIDGEAHILANKWFAIKAMWHELNTTGDIIARDSSSYGTNFYYTAANAKIVRDNSVEQYTSVSCGDPTDMNTLCSSAANRADAIAVLLAFCQTNHFTGVELDFEAYSDWDATQYANFKLFVTELGNALHAAGFKLQVCVPPIWNSSTTVTSNEWTNRNSQGYYLLKYEDFDPLPVDYLVPMCYDYQYDMSAGTPNSPLEWEEDILEWMRSKITDKSRIIAGLPSAGYSGATDGYVITGRTYDYLSAQTGFGTASRDSSSAELIWANAGTSYAAIDDTAINSKVAYARGVGVHRVSLWHVGDNKYGSGIQKNVTPIYDNPTTPAEKVLVRSQLSNGKCEGVTALVEYGESIVPGDILYIKNDGKYWKADADAESTAPAVALALETASSGQHLVLLTGIYRNDSLYAFTAGDKLYLSTTAGAMTATQPSGTDDVIQKLGIAISADIVFFSPTLSYITHT